MSDLPDLEAAARTVHAALRAYWTDAHNLAEGAGAAPLAALMLESERTRGKRVGVILCGGNINLALARRVLGDCYG